MATLTSVMGCARASRSRSALDAVRISGVFSFCVGRFSKRRSPVPSSSCLLFGLNQEILMMQDELNHAVAEATGENVATIVRRGFVLLAASTVEHEPPSIELDAFDSSSRYGAQSGRNA